MIDVKEAITFLKDRGFCFYTGVPDSLLKSFCDEMIRNVEFNVTAANEGNAVAIASGYYLATGKLPIVYLQNSGFGNVMNPLLSLIDEKVYNIPVLFIIGWRGEPNIKDEPQHITQGALTEDLCKTLDIAYSILSKKDDINTFKLKVNKAIKYMKETKKPYSLIISKGAFSDTELTNESKANKSDMLFRKDIIKGVINYLPENTAIISTTGKTSRELFELRREYRQKHERDFLTVGSMGHSSSIALGLSLSLDKLNIVCLDGEGALMMHMGALVVNGQLAGSNFTHVLINNGSHDSVGGQSNYGKGIDFSKIAKECGYKNTIKLTDVTKIKEVVNLFISKEGASFIQIDSCKGSDSTLGRPDKTPAENKKEFMEFIAQYRKK